LPFNGVNRRKVSVAASQRQRQRRFASIPVGGSRNEGAALKRSASHLDEQMIPVPIANATNGRANAAVCGVLRYCFCTTAM
ncbi:MAG: hypothetical protein LBB40_02155, partial [Holophagales bacterium]|nr:hypothetical protein [Holophagales bacterium]